MTEHLPECPILKPCCDDEQFPEHGFCGNYAGRCLHCMAECICEQLRACETRVVAAAVLRVEAIADDPESGVDWNWDYDIDPTGMTRNPLVWIREAVAAIKKGEQ
jgi:hypothetical protein